MIAYCEVCDMYFDDYDRDTICPHDQFPANDGHKNFSMKENSYLNKLCPSWMAEDRYVPRYPVPKN